MTSMKNLNANRRRFVQGVAAGAAAAAFIPGRFAIGGMAKVKVGILLPYSGTYAFLGEKITAGMKLAINQAGGKPGGRDIEYVQLDSEAKPPKATDNTNKLITGENIDFLVGPVHSGVAMAMAKIAREEKIITIVPNAGANQLTGSLCAPNIFRTSFSNWQPSYPSGKVVYDDGHRNVVTMAWNYGAGKQALGGFTQGFEGAGGKVVKQILTPFPKVEFQAYLTEIASLKPDAVFVFYAGGGAIKFVKDYAAAGLKDKIPLYSSGFLTEGTLKAQGAAAEGIKTTLHYVDTLDNPANRTFRPAFKKTTGKDADVYAVQGYDTGKLLVQAMESVKGDTGAQQALIAAMESMVIDSPRGEWSFSKAHNPVQDFYLRQVVGGENKFLGVAHKALAHPAKGCRMG